MEAIEAGQNFKVYVDYAHQKESMEGLLNTAKTIVKKDGKKIILLLGAEGGGRDKGKRGKVLQRTDEDRVVVEGVNIVKKHAKPNPMKGVAGGIIEKTMPIHQSNIAIFNGATGKADRVGVKVLADGKKVRVYKSSGEEIKVA